MSKKFWVGVLVLAVIVAGAYFYVRDVRHKVAPPQPAQAVVSSSSTQNRASASRLRPAGAVPAPPHYPVPAPKVEAKTLPPLPSLADSDRPFIGALKGIVGAQPVESYLVSSGLIRRIVTTVDDLGRTGPIPLRVRPVPETPGELVVNRQAGAVTLSPANSARYQPMVMALKFVDTQAIVDLYFHYYPLFQKAYEGLGFPNRYFNDRLIQVINEMLAAPEISGPIRLVQPHVLYRFADPKLEALTAGQKLMIRIGLQNEANVKTKLRAVRTALTSGKPEGGK